jgi:hypothetical protein
VIVEHYTASDTSPYAYFAANTADPELGELPGVCAHFVIDRDGTIYQLVPTRHDLPAHRWAEWTAFGDRARGTSDGQILGNPAQLARRSSSSG